VTTDVENYHTLQPPCGCIALYKRTTKTKDVVTFDSITLSKIQTYTYICTYSQSIVTECDPAPYNQGFFSHWESSFKYPCNQELYDSSWLNIRNIDIPNSIRDDFEDYYVGSISGIDYTLSSEIYRFTIVNTELNLNNQFWLSSDNGNTFEKVNVMRKQSRFLSSYWWLFIEKQN
jgi:hypothetical protein